MDIKKLPSICFVGLANLPILAREYNQFEAGGAQLQQTLLAKALVKRGYAVSMVIADYGQADKASWDGVVTYKAYRYEAGLPVLRFIYPRWTSLWSALKRADADVYHVTCAGMIVGLVGLFARRYNKKYIYRAAHDDDCNPDRLLIEYFRDRKLYEYGLRHAALVTTQSEYQKKLMRQHYHIDSLILSSMVEQAECQYDFEERTVPVLWVNYLRPYKRPELFLDIARNISDVDMHMIGGVSSEFPMLYPKIERMADSLQNFHFHGHVPYHDVNNYFEKTRVLVNTSESEGFSNSYLQAWVRGVPVVTFIDPDGVIEREGLGCCVNSLEEMCEAVRLYATDKGAWDQVSDRCKVFMNREFSDEKIMIPFLDAIDQVNV